MRYTLLILYHLSLFFDFDLNELNLLIFIISKIIYETYLIFKLQ